MMTYSLDFPIKHLNYLYKFGTNLTLKLTNKIKVN